MRQAFGNRLQKLLKDRGFTHREFAQRVGLSRSRITQIVSGAPPDWREAERWADSLQVIGRDREAFMDAMHLAAASPRIQRMVAKLRAAASGRE